MKIVQRNGPIIVNSTSKCFGAIARVRKTNIYHEKSIIDFLFFEMISSMDIDEACKYLTKYSTRLGVKSICERDHSLMVCNLSVKWDQRMNPIRLML